MRDWMKKAETGERAPLQFSTQNLAPVSTQTTGAASIMNTQSSVASAIDASVAQVVQSISHQQPASPESLAQMVTSMISRNNIVARQTTGSGVDEVDADLLLTKGGQSSRVGVAPMDGTPGDTSAAPSPFVQRPQTEDGFAIAFGREPSDDPTLDLVEDVSSEAKEVDSMSFETNRVDARDVKSARVMTREQVASAVANRMSDVHQAIHDLAQARNGGQMSIRMTPEDLGTIDVGVKIFGQKIDIDIQATDERVRTNLAVHRQELVQSVESKGLSLGSLNFGQQDSSDAQHQARDERFIDRQDFARAHAMSHKEPESTIMQHRDRSKFLVGAVDYQA